MVEDNNRTGDPAADAPVPRPTSSKFAWGCILLAIVFAILIALIYGANYVGERA